MKFKSVIIGSAAAAMAFGGAQAADMEHDDMMMGDGMQACSSAGVGFFHVPGSDTCMRISARVRADYNFTAKPDDKTEREHNYYGFAPSANIFVTAKTEMDSGPLTSFFEYGVGSGTIAKANITGFGGLTAGLAGSLYNVPATASDKSVNLLGYTVPVGGGLSASLSVEDGSARRSSAALYGGNLLPDFIAAVELSQGVIKAKVSGALHENRPADAAVSNKFGFAAAGGVEVGLGDAGRVRLGAEWARGATSYAGVTGDDFTVVDGAIQQNTAWNVKGIINLNLADGLTSETVGVYSRFDHKANKDNDVTTIKAEQTIEAALGAGMAISGNVAYTRTNPADAGKKTTNAFTGRLRFNQTF